MYPISSLLAAVLNRALNDELARFSGCHVALCCAGRRFVWRIDAHGKLAPAHPLIDADCLIDCKSGGVRISGSGELFSVLSALGRETDWFVVISNMFGSQRAPAVLYRLEQSAGALRQCAADTLTPVASGAAYRQGVADLQNRVLQISRRMDILLADAARRAT